MNTNSFLQITIYVVTLLLLAIPLGSYMAKVFQKKSTEIMVRGSE